jgi:hypothetical protein
MRFREISFCHRGWNGNGSCEKLAKGLLYCLNESILSLLFLSCSWSTYTSWRFAYHRNFCLSSKWPCWCQWSSLSWREKVWALLFHRLLIWGTWWWI